MINITKQFVEELKTPRECYVVAGKFQFDLIGLKGDALDLVESAEDVMQFNKFAALHGLSDGYKRLSEQYNIEELNRIFDNEELPDGIVTMIAEKVCEMSGIDFEKKIESYEVEEDDEEELEQDEDELTPGYPRA